MKSLNLDHLNAFATVVEAGSFSAAAKRLGLTQPAISLQVRQLEQRLGGPLIERVGRKAQPTPMGVEVLSHVGRIDAAVEAMLDGAARHGQGGAGRIRIGTGATACIYLLPPVLRDLRGKYPNLDIVVSTNTTDETLRGIEDNVIDLGLVTMPASGRMLEVTPVLDDEFVAIAPPDLPLPEQVTAAYLSEVSVLLEPDGNARRVVEDWFVRNGVRPRPAMSLGSEEAIKEMVRAGLGCALLPSLAIRKGQDNGFQVRSLTPVLFRQLAVVIRRDKRLHRVLRDTLNALQGLAG